MAGFSITFEENGGTPVTDLTEQTTLPDPLPTPTKANNVFAGWYLDSSFTQKAVAGAAIESDVTLYAKWYTPASWCKDIADAIREKEGSEDPIKHVDFADRITALPSQTEEKETRTLTPDFSNGNQVIAPTSGKVLSQVTLTKPADLLPENIAKDKNICGVVGTSFTAIELTQTQYDGLTPDDNTYYLIDDGTSGSGSSGGVELIIDETSYGSSITLSIGSLADAAGKEFFLQLEFGSGPDNTYCLTLDSIALYYILVKAANGMTTTVHPLRTIPDGISGPISYTETVTVTVVDIDPETGAATVKFDIDIESYEHDIRAKLYSWDVE